MVRIDAPVAQERPVPTRIGDARPITGGEKNFLAVVARPCQHVTERIGNERGAPKLKIPFHADAIYRGDEHPVRNGMAALDGFPCRVLRGAKRLLLARMPADRRTIASRSSGE